MMAVDPMITEFQASNQSTVKDEDGDTSDWIEIRNPDSAAVDLAGWYLTDDIGQLTKWRLPARTVAAGEHLLVFASGKDRALPAGPLHTNFRLTSDGEYLALVKPDGRTVVQSFNPYPPQFENQSYGLAANKDVTQLIASDAALKAKVPTDDSQGLRWTQADFDDSGWMAGKQSAGFEVLRPGFTITDSFDGPLDPAWTVDIPAGGTSSVTVDGGSLNFNVPSGQRTSSSSRGLAPFVTRAIPGERTADYEFITQVQQGTNDRGDGGLVVVDSSTGLPIIQLEYSGRTVFRLLAKDTAIGFRNSGNRNAYWLRLVRDSFAGTWTGFYRLTDADSWSQVGVVRDGVHAPVLDNPRIGLYATTAANLMNPQHLQFQFVAPDQRPLYAPQTGLDLRSSMYQRSSSVYLRVPFTVPGDPRRFDELQLNLRMDDGARVYLNGTEVASYNVPVVSTWNSSASGEYGGFNGAIPVRTFDLQPYRDLLRTGSNLLAVQGMNVSAEDSDFFFDATLTARQLLGTSFQYFTSPTPGALNQSAAAPPPRIVAPQGAFFGSTTVKLEVDSTNPGLAIFYTTNGSVPTTGSQRYTEPIVLSATAMLQARTFDLTPNSLLEPSPIVAGTFLAIGDDLRDRTSDIPMIVLDMMGQGLPNSTATTLASVNVVALDVSRATGRSSFAAPIVDYLGRGGIRDRGSSTGGQTKPNLAFETWGADGRSSLDDADVGLLGFAPESDWVLHAPFDFDRALIRNQIAYRMANELGRWAPGTRPVEVFLNRRDGVVTAADYVGVYILTEKIKVGPDRVDLVDIQPTDTTEPAISGGYMWKIDREDPGEPSFTTPSVALNWVEPKSPNNRSAPVEDRATLTQENWVKEYFTKLSIASRVPNINDPEGYSKYIDVLSWVDHNLVSVLCDNVDALNLSTYLFKDRGKKVEFGPQWDFDRSMESTDDRDNNPLLWGGSGGTAFFTSNLWAPLFRDPGFWQAYIDRWTELRRGVLSDEGLNLMIDSEAAQVAESQDRNFKKWTGVKPRTASAYASGQLNGTWQGEVEHLRTWLLERAHFMDQNFVRPLTAYVDSTIVSPDTGLVVRAGDQFRLDGEIREVFDDRMIITTDGSQVPLRYLAIADDSLGTDWTQPAFDDKAWGQGTMGIGFEPEPPTYGPLLTTRISLPAGGTTLLTRTEFQVDDPRNIGQLVLRTRYDDGYVAYLNGTEIVRRNLLSNTLTWNSRANTRANSVSLVFEDVPIQKFANLLVPGRNVLAIRLLNSSSTNNDMFLQAALVDRTGKPGNHPVGKAYYTTNGSDPRGPDGKPSAAAILYTPGDRITITGNTRIVTRNFDDVIDRGTEAIIVRSDWSAPLAYNFVTETPSLRISEIHYHPATGGLETSGGESEEFVEITNEGTTAASLVGVRLRGEVEFDFLRGATTLLQPGQRAVVVANAGAFRARYGDSIPIAGTFTGRLSNGGGELQLVDGAGRVLSAVDYRDNGPWPLSADGVGASLELVAVAGTDPRAAGKWYHWTGSQQPGGSPGLPNPGRPAVVINEVAARAGGSLKNDAIELVNVSTQAVNLTGWYLSDSSDNLLKYPIPAGTVLQPGQTIVFDERQFNPSAADPRITAFGLNGLEGDSVWLVVGNGRGGVAQFVDDVHFGGMRAGESFGRLPNATGRLAPQQAPSLGSANGAARGTTVGISEVHYHPQVLPQTLAVAPAITADELEFVELHNGGTQPVDLSGWRLRGGVEFDFPAGTTLAAGQRLALLAWDPAHPENGLRLRAFQAQYDPAAEIRLLGGYAGQLGDSDDRLTLLRPEVVTPGNPPELAYVQEDEVLYDDLAPWPLDADGAGSSLQRSSLAAFGNDGRSWAAGRPSPGSAVALVRGDFNGDAVVNGVDINLLFQVLQSGGNDPRFDLTGDRQVNEQDRDELIVKILGTSYGDANLDGVFDSRDLIEVFQRGGYADNTSRNGAWENGDWNGDGEFESSDLVLAAQQGAYVPVSPKPIAAVAAALHATVDRLFEDDDSDW
jgi:hypothetical protein